jgi:large subunit ribosomal protein L21
MAATPDIVASAMYAVIRTGGKQYRVAEGDRVQVERLGEPGSEVSLTTVMLVDGETTLATPAQLKGSSVSARIIDEVKGPKIIGFTYKNKANERRRWGHRQTYATIEITGITKG